MLFTAWLRNHCMQVFHYCAEVLKDRNIFVTCTDKQLRERQVDRESGGAKYNDFDNDPLQLLNDSCGSLSESEQEIVNEECVGQQELDKIFLKADEEDEDRWVFEHPLFDNSSVKTSTPYKNKVLALVNEWDSLDVFDDHIYR